MDAGSSLSVLDEPGTMHVLCLDRIVTIYLGLLLYIVPSRTTSCPLSKNFDVLQCFRLVSNFEEKLIFTYNIYQCIVVHTNEQHLPPFIMRHVFKDTVIPLGFVNALWILEVFK